MAEFEETPTVTPTPVETIETKTSSGVETLGQRDYRSILREENPTLSKLLKQTLTGEVEIAKEEEDGDYGDAMLSMERTEANGFADGLSAAYQIIFNKEYASPVQLADSDE